MGGIVGKKREIAQAGNSEASFAVASDKASPASRVKAEAIRVRLRWRQGDELTEVQLLASHVGELLSRATELVQPRDEQSPEQAFQNTIAKSLPAIIFCGHNLSCVPGEVALTSLIVGTPSNADGIVAWAAPSEEHLDLCIQLQGLFLEVCENNLNDKWQCSVSAGDAIACEQHMRSGFIAKRPTAGCVSSGAIFADPCIYSPADTAKHMLSWQDNVGRTSLNVAVDAADNNMCEWLIDARADVNDLHNDESPLDRCLNNSCIPDSMTHSLCLKHGASAAAWNLLSPSERCFRAAMTGRIWLVEEMLRREGFLDKVADVVRLPSKWTLLHEAAVNGDQELVDFIRRCAPLLTLARDGYNRLPLHYAAQEGHAVILPLLAGCAGDQGRKVTFLDTADLLGRSPLWAAARGGHVASCAWFMECGCDPLLRDNCGTSAVWQAACAPAGLESPPRVLPLLLQGFLSPDGSGHLSSELLMSTADESGFTVMHAAARENATPAMLWIHEHADPAALAELISARSHKGETALRLACLEGHVEAVDLLLRWGAGELACSDDSDLRAWALSLGHEDVAALLWERGPTDGEAVRGARLLAYAAAAVVPLSSPEGCKSSPA